jgi:hypothetical protein
VISGENAIIGSCDDDIGINMNQGSAYIFVRSGTNWLQQTKLTASDGLTDDNFGFSVFISGIHAVVGSYLEDGGFTNQGSAYFVIKN